MSLSMYRNIPSKTFQLLCLSAFFITTSITIFVTAASYLVVKPLNFIAPNPSPINAQIILTAELISADATMRTLTMNWYPGLASGCTPDTNFVADIYFDPDLLDVSSPSFSLTQPFLPAYQLNASQFCGSTAPVDFAVFQTVTKLLGSNLNAQLSSELATLQEYPFDVYDAHFLIYARDHDTGGVITLNVTKSYGVAVNFEVTPTRTVIEGNLKISPYLVVYLQVGRAKAAKAFVILVGVSNWLVAAAFLVISASTLIYPNPRHYAEMFVLPIGVLFAFTSIRANLPGAPAGFGARIDLYTILPVLVVVTLCGFFLLLMVLLRRLYDGKPISPLLSYTPGPAPSTLTPEIEIPMQKIVMGSELGTVRR
ncbi:hypothetical protein CPB84DRAFT_910731 [Gymnopilus junonius]|uniref:Transmembrane protein n=1 Tax=Gymnopilus junonius TaxID=109634 RepID=A0A9P5NR59_GYMJU|nr:hypothetical protein CPB84DRAFT_910731 [Gymnopilus junonius]